MRPHGAGVLGSPNRPSSVHEGLLGPRARQGPEAEIDRACNAAPVTVSSRETQSACGAEGSGRENGPAQPAAAQEGPVRGKPVAAPDGNRRP